MEQRFEVPNEPHWDPLAKLLQDNAIPHQMRQFMYIGRSIDQEGNVISIYKHIRTRRCINIDSHLNTYAYSNPPHQGNWHNEPTYRKIEQAEAIKHVFS